MTKQNKAIDWEGVERDFRAGVMSIREIAKWYGISDTAIHKKAKADGWERKQQPPHIDRKALIGEIVAAESGQLGWSAAPVRLGLAPKQPTVIEA